MRIYGMHSMRMRDVFREIFLDMHQYAYYAYRNAHNENALETVPLKRLLNAYQCV